VLNLSNTEKRKELRTKETIKNWLEDLDERQVFDLWNNYARENNPDDEIFDNDEDFFDTFFSGRVMEAIRSISYGDYTYSHDYVKFNGYGNLESFSSYDLMEYIDIDELANDILENEQNYYSDELCGIEEYDEEDEEETEE
jgi:hypothetical protein